MLLHLKSELNKFVVFIAVSLIVGNIYKKNSNNDWELQVNLEGPVGDSINIIAALSFSGLSDDDVLEKVSFQIEAAGFKASDLDNDELIAVNYTAIDDNTIKSYWYYAIQGIWHRSLLTGSLVGLIQNSYDPTNDIDRTYSINYINSLIKNQIGGVYDKDLNTYSIKIIEDMLSWGKF